MKILFTICGRAGSKGLKNKNLKVLNGVPLVFYSLAAIKGYMDKHPEDYVKVAVNTDSDDLVELIKYQTQINVSFVQRNPEMAGDLAPKVAVIQDTYKAFGLFAPDIVIDLDITSPNRRIVDIENVIQKSLSLEYDLVFSVVNARRSPYFNMVEEKKDLFYRKICQSKYTARQQAPKTYEMNASIYAYKPAFLDGPIENTILDYRCGIIVMPDYLVLDIDSEEDFEMMEYLHNYFCKKDPGLQEVYELSLGMMRN